MPPMRGPPLPRRLPMGGMRGRSRSTARHEAVTAGWLRKPPGYLLGYAIGRSAWSVAKAVERWIESSPVSVRVTRHPARRGSSSSSTTHGAGACRSWSVTVWSDSGCLDLRLTRYADTSEPARSASGTATGRPSDSLRSSTVGDGIIGTAVVTHAEEAVWNGQSGLSVGK